MQRNLNPPFSCALVVVRCRSICCSGLCSPLRAVIWTLLPVGADSRGMTRAVSCVRRRSRRLRRIRSRVCRSRAWRTVSARRSCRLCRRVTRAHAMPQHNRRAWHTSGVCSPQQNYSQSLFVLKTSSPSGLVSGCRACQDGSVSAVLGGTPSRASVSPRGDNSADITRARSQAVREEKQAARMRAKTQADVEVPTLPIPHFLPITRWCAARAHGGFRFFKLS